VSARPPLAECEDAALEQLAATAKALAEGLVVAAHRNSSEPQQHRRLQLVGVDDCRRPGEGTLAARVRCYLRARRLRDGLFPKRIFSDPAWDMLLDLYACKAEGTRVGVSNACLAANVPSTTALRYVDRLEECGLVERQPDPEDNRRIYVELTDVAAWRIELWLNATFDEGPEAD
jgi:DNA-binding MarR family transcriptional regulator